MPSVEPPDTLTSLQLIECPECSYSLRGLGESGRCPECGAAFSPESFLLRGIPRGMSNMSPMRILLWILMAMATWIGPSGGMIIMQEMDLGWAVCLALLFLWLSFGAYLLISGKREKKGMETFIFKASGFGSGAASVEAGVTDTRMVPWSEVNAVELQRKGPQWWRLRIGQTDRPGGKMRQCRLDFGVRATATEIAEIRSRIDTLMDPADRPNTGPLGRHPPTKPGP